MRKFLASFDDHHQRPPCGPAFRNRSRSAPCGTRRIAQLPRSHLRIEAARRTCLMAERLRKPAIYARFCIRFRSPKPSMCDGI